MSWKLSSFAPKRISGQIAVIIVASLIMIHVVLTATFILTRPDPRTDRPPDQLVTLIKLVDATPAESRPRLIAEIAAAFPQFALARAGSPPEGSAQSGHLPQFDGLQRHLGPDYQITPLRPGAVSDDGASDVAIRLKDGEFITARHSRMPTPPPLGPLGITLLSIAIILTLLGLWAARSLTEPLRRFAKAAENFSPNGGFAPLPERGPYEIRAAARALNQMRERVKSLIGDRTRMLAAVGHDLRTPITRLRLWCEFIEDHATRAQMLSELTHMNSMIEGVLNFLRDGQSQHPATMIDVATSLQTICDQFIDMGHNVSYIGPDHVVVSAQAEELHRALTNLIDNAIRYGGKAAARVTPGADSVVIAIEDDGPGIRDGDKDAMLEPFVRGDAARGMNNKTGFGLGLSIAQAVIKAHGGTLVLRDHEPSGLIAQVTLPLPGTASN